MVYYIKLGATLFIIAAIASGVLAFVNSFTKPIIEENQRQAEIAARQEVLPEADTFEHIEAALPYYKGYDEQGELIGYTFVAVGAGYSGDIQTMVGLTKDYNIRNITVISQTETPGLGANVTRRDFLDQYKDRSLDELVLDVDTGDIEIITGATITARTLNSSVKEASHQVIEQIEQGAREEDTDITTQDYEEAA